MQYTEQPIPASLDGWVAAIWKLENDGNANAWVSSDAAPDGCVELIFRTNGRSTWGGEQPPCFVAGIAETTANLRFSGDSAFLAVRFWPWAWNRIAKPSCPDLMGTWHAIDENSVIGQLPKLAQSAPEVLEAQFVGKTIPDIAQALLHSASVAEIAARCGQSPRQIQRWFAREVGVPPRRYIRLLRFRAAVIGLGSNGVTMADHAADRGYADQAHMARDFKLLAGTAPSKARRTVNGPFLSPGDQRARGIP
jgi:AraC-like DNA-binding protein